MSSSQRQADGAMRGVHTAIVGAGEPKVRLKQLSSVSED